MTCRHSNQRTDDSAQLGVCICPLLQLTEAVAWPGLFFFLTASQLGTAVVSVQVPLHTPHARTHTPHTLRVLKQTYNYTQTGPRPSRDHRNHPRCRRRRARRSPSVAPRA